MFQSGGLNCRPSGGRIEQNRRIFRAQTRLNFFAGKPDAIDKASENRRLPGGVKTAPAGMPHGGNGHTPSGGLPIMVRLSVAPPMRRRAVDQTVRRPEVAADAVVARNCNVTPARLLAVSCRSDWGQVIESGPPVILARADSRG